VPTILIVDDDPAIRQMLDLIFEQEGFTVFTASNGRKALHLPMLRAGQIDVVITDVMMPEMDGLAFTENLKAQQPHLPVLILSACIEYLDVGSVSATQVMSKPFDVKALLHAVRCLLDKRVAPAAA
jgi:DNA-binding response OmpR family regulator